MADSVITCGAACTVTVKLEPSSVDMDRVADYGALFGLLLVAVVVVGCAKGLVNLFWKNHED
jgi:hypothetical protein